MMAPLKVRATRCHEKPCLCVASVHPVKDHVASSTKVKFLLKELAEIEKRPGCEKSVIFRCHRRSWCVRF